ncbi:hypothetical protein H5410_032440 [Solanum commersonii]|uniref:Uncharacterized protein n=1 Tax=Solanum commersonii TaxID=4109 RepID=A0A9J5YQB1_SOLCO|nr:hypothetical protein H5410_032440 [Solanum commersonii]
MGSELVASSDEAAWSFSPDPVEDLALDLVAWADSDREEWADLEPEAWSDSDLDIDSSELERRLLVVFASGRCLREELLVVGGCPPRWQLLAGRTSCWTSSCPESLAGAAGVCRLAAPYCCYFHLSCWLPGEKRRRAVASLLQLLAERGEKGGEAESERGGEEDTGDGNDLQRSTGDRGAARKLLRR